jgi:hypothetical protein
MPARIFQFLVKGYQIEKLCDIMTKTVKISVPSFQELPTVAVGWTK